MGSTVRSALIKICEFLLTALLVSFFTFVVFSIIPGDTARVMLGPNASEEQVQALREELGLNAPLATRYISWLGDAAKGDFGKSISFGQPVGELIASRLPVTLGMSLIALIFVLVISFPMAAFCSRNPGDLTDKTLSTAGHILFAIPPFALSMMLILLFSKCFHIFAAGRYTAPSANFGAYLVSLLLPSFCIALPKIAMTFKFLRASMIEYSRGDFVRTAKSHGLSDLRIMLRHIIPNSAVSSVTVISLVLSDILGGSLIVEQVFNLPGLGRLLLSAISRRDFPLLSGIVFYLAMITVLLYFLSDVISAMIDPRIRDGRAST
jgi:ABC-type dipeptide/oligopeptide/nickel transport system permease component